MRCWIFSFLFFSASILIVILFPASFPFVLLQGAVYVYSFFYTGSVYSLLRLSRDVFPRSKFVLTDEKFCYDFLLNYFRSCERDASEWIRRWLEVNVRLEQLATRLGELRLSVSSQGYFVDAPSHLQLHSPLSRVWQQQTDEVLTSVQSWLQILDLIFDTISLLLSQTTKLQLYTQEFLRYVISSHLKGEFDFHAAVSYLVRIDSAVADTRDLLQNLSRSSANLRKQFDLMVDRIQIFIDHLRSLDDDVLVSRELTDYLLKVSQNWSSFLSLVEYYNSSLDGLSSLMDEIRDSKVRLK